MRKRFNAKMNDFFYFEYFNKRFWSATNANVWKIDLLTKIFKSEIYNNKCRLFTKSTKVHSSNKTSKIL